MEESLSTIKLPWKEREKILKASKIASTSAAQLESLISTDQSVCLCFIFAFLVEMSVCLSLRLYILYYAIRCQHLTGHDRIHWNSSKYGEHSFSQTRRDIVNLVPSGQKFLCSYLDCKQATCQKLSFTVAFQCTKSDISYNQVIQLKWVLTNGSGWVQEASKK